MRGSHVIDSSVRAHDGIIPADAGLTCWRYSRRHLSWDHPRGCGAHDFQQINTTVTTGSSPRMRGSPYVGHGQMVPDGIIPADAGLTNRRTYNAASSGDHPRGCGAHQPTNIQRRVKRGSSPRMRGSHASRINRQVNLGIIPADAGLTPTREPDQFMNRDHPRGCGAHYSPLSSNNICRGSSPRMRGSQRFIRR